MAKHMFRGAAAALCAAALLAAGCTGGTSISPANVAGTWSGAFTLSYEGDGETTGLLSLTLEQVADSASGIFTWVPKDTARSVTANVVGDVVTLRLHFRCAETDIDSTAPNRPETTTLSGTVSDTTLSISAASGFACPAGGAPRSVVAATGVLSRTSNKGPL